MERNIAEELFAACERTLGDLTAAEMAIRRIADSEEQATLLRALSNAITEVLAGVRAPVVRQYPDLEPPAKPGVPDTELDEEALAVVSRLTPADIEFIDSVLLAECAPSWRKVARIVGTAMNSLQTRFEEIPDGYYAQRVAALVHAATLESQGNLQYMRFSEVRLSRK